MKAVIVVLNQEGGVARIIGPFEHGQAAANHSATLAWSEIRMVFLLEEPPRPAPTPSRTPASGAVTPNAGSTDG